MTDQPYLIAQTIVDATAALSPEKPLPGGDERWQDFTAGRGDRVTTLMTRLLQSHTDDFHRLVFSSHRGAGKTTELNQLAQALQNKYKTIYIEANVEMHPHDIEIEDLLLVMAQIIDQVMREEQLQLPQKLLFDIASWFGQTIKTTSVGTTYLGQLETHIQAKAGVPYFSKLMANLKALFKTESTHKTEVKEVLRKFPKTLAEAVNKLLDAANEKLKNKNQELLVIIDNLDRYPPQVIDTLISRNAERFKSLHCHFILTPPINLYYRPESENLEQNYRCFTMPTIKLRQAGQPYDHFAGPGHDLLLKALAKRINLEKLVPEPKTQDRLVFGSGGSIRNLLELAQDASLEADGDFIVLEDVNRALSRHRSRLRNRINALGLMQALVHISHTKQLDEGEPYRQALYYRLAFMYNGAGWYDIHPLISELDEFKQAHADHQTNPPTT
ncbi:P-loop NTPase fold protein [Acanthopleuribacter pedis]|uniref:AAA family ATPase n=1 Tax=Acanthopleuribacter pedis TaxID=442870 RepID=A0A8J7QI68_9BACT|nr:P-loop NTPase fold protein [Acanthopleuribacter pedis]MBO1321116.1 AAA family ATPase [Acanthopleuribacter pedis]